MKISEGNWYLRREYKRADPVLMAAYRKLPKQDRMTIDALVMMLCEKIDGMGPASALELLYKLGKFILKGNGK